MKKNLLVHVCLTLIVFILSEKSHAIGVDKISLLIDLNKSKANGSYFSEKNIENDIGLGLGVRLEKRFNQNIGFKIDLSLGYTQFKMKYIDKIINGQVAINESLKIFTVEVPILLYIPFSPNNQKNFLDIDGGIVFVYHFYDKRSGEYALEYSSLNSNNSFSGRVGNFKKFNLGITMGWCLKLPGESKFFMDIRYVRYLFNFIDPDKKTTEDELPYLTYGESKLNNFKYGNFKLKIGYRFK